MVGELLVEVLGFRPKAHERRGRGADEEHQSGGSGQEGEELRSDRRPEVDDLRPRERGRAGDGADAAGDASEGADQRRGAVFHRAELLGEGDPRLVGPLHGAGGLAQLRVERLEARDRSLVQLRADLRKRSAEAGRPELVGRLDDGLDQALGVALRLDPPGGQLPGAADELVDADAGFLGGRGEVVEQGGGAGAVEAHLLDHAAEGVGVDAGLQGLRRHVLEGRPGEPHVGVQVRDRGRHLGVGDPRDGPGQVPERVGEAFERLAGGAGALRDRLAGLFELGAGGQRVGARGPHRDAGLPGEVPQLPPQALERRRHPVVHAGDRLDLADQEPGHQARPSWASFSSRRFMFSATSCASLARTASTSRPAGARAPCCWSIGVASQARTAW